MQINIQKQYQFLFTPKRYKVIFSGRAAGKSVAIAQWLLVAGLQSEERILCCRELQLSIADSSKKLLEDLNTKYNLGYEVTRDSIRHPVSKTEFLFYGIKTNITKLKSLEGITKCWVEEAETISQESLDILIPTIRKDGSELIFSFNPNSEFDPVYKRFVEPYIKTLTNDNVYADQQHYIMKTGYWDNIYLPQTIKIEIETLKADDYPKYLHIYRGDPVSDTELSLIKPVWFQAAIDAHIKLNFKPLGIRGIGFDVADEGSDNKALVRRHGVVVNEIQDWGTGDMDEACERVYACAIENKIQDVVYDKIGVGAGVKYIFNRIDKELHITGFVGSASPTNPQTKYKDDQTNEDMFRNHRAQAYWNIRDRFENTYKAVIHDQYFDPDTMISIDSSCEFIELLKYEITSIRRKSGLSNNRILIESKQDMKRRGIKSPNVADALVYCFTAEYESITGAPIINIQYESNW